MKNRYFIIPIDPYTQDILFIIGDEKYCDKVSKRLLGDNFEKTEHASSSSLGYTKVVKNQFILICMPKFDNTFDDYETLIHECVHAISMMYTIKGMSLKMNKINDQESMAYLTGYLFSRALMKLVPAKKKRRR